MRSILLLLLPFLVLADHHNPRDLRPHRRLNDRSLQPRGFRATFYAVGLGACGKTNYASEYVIALNVPQYAGGLHCFQTVTISYQGKTAQAQIVDECEGCPYGAIDMSRSLFNFFADPSLGQIDVDWHFGGGGPPPPPPPPPKPSSTPAPSPTSTWSPSPTPTPSPKTSTISSSNSTTTYPSASNATQSTTQSASGPAATQTAGSTLGNLSDLDRLVIAFGQFVLSAGQ